MMIKGIDVSYANSTIEWKKVKDVIDFAIIGGYADNTNEHNNANFPI